LPVCSKLLMVNILSARVFRTDRMIKCVIRPLPVHGL